jgi:hypothetical protein
VQPPVRADVEGACVVQDRLRLHRALHRVRAPAPRIGPACTTLHS